MTDWKSALAALGLSWLYSETIIVQHHRSPLLTEIHDTSAEAMKKLREEYYKKQIQQ